MMPRWPARLLTLMTHASPVVLLLLQASCRHHPVRTARESHFDAREERQIADLSEADRKATARAAFAEGIQLQEQNDVARALPRFEAAERLYDAPTHLLHIAQCQASLGRLVEAKESYAALSHLTLNAQAPRAFREAQETGRAELSRLESRVPTLRLEASPPPTSLRHLVVSVNGMELPSDLLGVARPVNPGRYHVTMKARGGRSGSGDVEIREGETKTIEVLLAR
jgi:hypothetical protein